MTTDRLHGVQRAAVYGLCVASGSAYLQPATYNYIVNPMLVTFQSSGQAAAPLREVPSIVALLVIFMAARPWPLPGSGPGAH